MFLEYIEIIIKLNGKTLGKVIFEPGQGSKASYIKRANLMSQPYLHQDKKNLNLEYEFKRRKYNERKLLEVFIPTFD